MIIGVNKGSIDFNFFSCTVNGAVELNVDNIPYSTLEEEV